VCFHEGAKGRKWHGVQVIFPSRANLWRPQNEKGKKWKNAKRILVLFGQQ
jgi:hypothetical protein